MRFFFSPILFFLGIVIMKYTVIITNNTGKIDFAEKFLGTGIGAGTYTFWRLFGLLMCALAVLWFFGLLPSNNISLSTP